MDLPSWQTGTRGPSWGEDGSRVAPAAEGIQIGRSGDGILGRPAFAYARTQTQLELVVLSAAELGVEADAASHADVYRRAKQLGLERCPAEVGPQLRLGYRNQPLAEPLGIAMGPGPPYAGRPT